MRLLRKGWMRWEGSTRRVVVDNYGKVFWQGCGGWANPPEGTVLKVLPTRWEHTYWPGSGWWGKNWRSPTWAWVYGAVKMGGLSNFNSPATTTTHTLRG